MSATVRPTSSGAGCDSGDRERVAVDRQRRRRARQLVPRASPATPGRGRRPCAPRRGVSISAANDGRMLNVNGSRRFIWNDERPARHLRPHLDAVGPAPRRVRRHDLLVPREALDREQRGPRERAADLALEVEHVGVRDHSRRAAGRRRPGPRRAAARAARRARRGRRPATAPAGRRRRCGSATRWWRSRWRRAASASATTCCMPRHLVVGGRRARSLVAHHVEAHRGVADVAAVVEQRRPARSTASRYCGNVSKSSHGTPAQRVEAHVLDVLQRAGEQLAVLGPDRGDREAAVAGDDAS